MSALFYVMFKKELLANNMEEALIINNDNNLVEASSSNVFLCKDGQWFTPNLETGAVAGVMRGFILEHFEVQEEFISSDSILDYDEIFISNAVKLVQPVLNFREKNLVQIETDKLITKTKNILEL